MMKNVNLQIEVEIHPQVIWRLKLFMAIMRFAVWVGGFGGVEFDIPERHLTPLALDGVPPREVGDLTPDDVREKMARLAKPRRQ